MTIDALIMLAGFLVAAMPFLGFPTQWDNVILVTLGILVIALGIVVRRRGFARKAPLPKTNASFVESAPKDAEHEER